jgi:hypothetical protein
MGTLQEALEEAANTEEPTQEVIESEVSQTDEEEVETVSEVLEKELETMRGASSDESSETAVAEEGESEGDYAGESEEGAGGVSEEDEESWLAGQSERSQERYRQLAERARAAEHEAAQVRQQGQELYKIMSDSGVTPEDMTSYFEYHKAIRNGGDASPYWSQMEQAHSQFTGNKVGNADPLNNHPDLKAQVDEFEVTEEAARELASLRDYSVRMKQVEEQNAQQQAHYGQLHMEQQQAATYAHNASVELDRWSEDMKSKDPQFSAKEALILERAQEQFPNMHPAYWPEFVAREYAYISKAMPGQEAEKVKTPNTIRPGSSGSAPMPEAKSIGDALTNALREMRE